MKNWSLIIFGLICFSLFSCKKKQVSLEPGSEEFFKNEIQKKIGGKLEYSVKNGRVDLLTEEVAYEVTWASEWKDAIGKSLWYGMQTHRASGIILIVSDKSDEKYISQLKSTLSYMSSNKEIIVKVYPKDFE